MSKNTLKLKVTADIHPDTARVRDKWAERYGKPRTIGDVESAFGTIGEMESRVPTIGDLEES